MYKHSPFQTKDLKNLILNIKFIKHSFTFKTSNIIHISFVNDIKDRQMHKVSFKVDWLIKEKI